MFYDNDGSNHFDVYVKQIAYAISHRRYQSLDTTVVQIRRWSKLDDFPL